jgi:hypothetical protein
MLRPMKANPGLGAVHAVVALDWRLLGVLSHQLTDVPFGNERPSSVDGGGLQEFDGAVFPEAHVLLLHDEIRRIPRADPTPLPPVIIDKTDAMDLPPQNRLQFLTFDFHLNALHPSAPFGAP